MTPPPAVLDGSLTLDHVAQPSIGARGSVAARRSAAIFAGCLIGLVSAVVLVAVPVAWPLAFVAILIAHLLHTVRMGGQHRWWHTTHCLMALSMAYMYLPGNMDAIDIAAIWQLVFAAAAALVLAWIVVALVRDRAVNILWVFAFVDLAAMIYMWSMSSFVAPITWILVAYFLAQTIIWATNRHKEPEGGPRVVRLPAAIGRRGTEATAKVEPLVGEMDLRLTMSLMSLGMAYMFAIMQFGHM